MGKSSGSFWLYYIILVIVIYVILAAIKPDWVLDRGEQRDDASSTPGGFGKGISIWLTLLWSVIIAFLVLGVLYLIRS